MVKYYSKCTFKYYFNSTIQSLSTKLGCNIFVLILVDIGKIDEIVGNFSVESFYVIFSKYVKRSHRSERF